ncbi:hypothetical protein IQ255_00220 [Pleurocapsales cyanobacterium LEGE 10410]|nr:hypothetical protein [Pleurocapsales cyanobacterium LEGE 10410]
MVLIWNDYTLGYLSTKNRELVGNRQTICVYLLDAVAHGGNPQDRT